MDMSKIEIPKQLADLTYMLPGADVEGNNSAWSFLLQLAERVSTLTEVTPVLYFDKDMEVDYSKHKDPDYISAIYEAIAGRMGSRLIKIDDDPDRNCLMVYVNFAPQDFPKLM